MRSDLLFPRSAVGKPGTWQAHCHTPDLFTKGNSWPTKLIMNRTGWELGQTGLLVHVNNENKGSRFGCPRWRSRRMPSTIEDMLEEMSNLETSEAARDTIGWSLGDSPLSADLVAQTLFGSCCFHAHQISGKWSSCQAGQSYAIWATDFSVLMLGLLEPCGLVSPSLVWIKTEGEKMTEPLFLPTHIFDRQTRKFIQSREGTAFTTVLKTTSLCSI